MATEIASVHDIFPHIRIVMGMVIGLGVTRLLSGLARIVQHPGQYRLYPVHLAWVASMLLLLVHFWWWEFGLYTRGLDLRQVPVPDLLRHHAVPAVRAAVSGFDARLHQL